MCLAAAIAHISTAILMLGRPDCGVARGSVRTATLLHRNVGDRGPIRLSGNDIQSLVKIDAEAQPGLVHLEEMTEPPAEEGNHGGVAIGKADAAILLGSLSGVEGCARSQEGLLVQGTK